jgi:hypothetical protein
MLASFVSVAVPRGLIAGGLCQLAKVASGASGVGLFSRQDRSYAVVPPTRTSHQEVLEHLGKILTLRGKLPLSAARREAWAEWQAWPSPGTANPCALRKQ